LNPTDNNKNKNHLWGLRTAIKTTRFGSFSAGSTQKVVKIHYFCHPLYNKEVAVLYRFKKAGQHYYMVTLFDKTRAYLPEWMTDPISCQSCELQQQPVCSLSALYSLKKFLNRF
jgi:hypothetical protein